jgi:hypothetical protein
MHPHERLRALIAGRGCTACGGSLAIDRVRVLAERDDLAFVEWDCAACGSSALAMVTGADGARHSVEDDGDGVHAGHAPHERRPGLPHAPPIDESDVLAMRELLRAHRGGLRDLLAPAPRDGDRPGLHGNAG